MREIKTIAYQIDRAASFDAAINALLADGWELKKRELLNVAGYPGEAFHIPTMQVFYAELERERV